VVVVRAAKRRKATIADIFYSVEYYYCAQKRTI
jgi:hypothetical protein